MILCNILFFILSFYDRKRLRHPMTVVDDLPTRNVSITIVVMCCHI